MLADHRETAQPVELASRPVVAAGRDQRTVAREAGIERIEKGRRDAAPERVRSDDEPVDVDRFVVEELPRDGTGQANLVERPEPVQPGGLQSLEGLRHLRYPVRCDQLGLHRVGLALKSQHGPGDRLVR